MEIGPVALWEWWWVLSPFALAVVWWTWADWSGFSKKAVVKKERRQAGPHRQEPRIPGYPEATL